MGLERGERLKGNLRENDWEWKKKKKNKKKY
jgi:hypothetical protein